MLASALANIANLAYESGQLQEARKLAHDALANARRLVEVSDGSRQSLLDLSGHLAQCVVIARRLDEPDEADSMLREREEIRARLAAGA
jgi:ABC-type phosphate transport system ATPase subunit